MFSGYEGIWLVQLGCRGKGRTLRKMKTRAAVPNGKPDAGSRSRREFLGLAVVSAVIPALDAIGQKKLAEPWHQGWSPLQVVHEQGWDFGGGKMLCFANRSPIQMLSTVFLSKTGHVAVVDGGFFDDGDFLFEKLLELGGRVDHWFITHAHKDHYGALDTIMRRPDFARLKIGELVYSFPDLDWMERMGDSSAKKLAAEFLKKLRAVGKAIPQRRYVKGEVVRLDGGITFEVLNDYNLDIIKCSPVNGTSICLGVNMGNRRILVTGDVSADEGHWLTDTADKTKFKADIVFMAHHGQQGAPKRFYEMVKPEAAIWPAPQWLWDNASGDGGPGSGPYHTNYTKTWMQDLGVKLHYPMNKDYIFE